jgi:hypothetical protein
MRMIETGKPPSTGQRNRAARLRHAVDQHETVTPDDLAWLLDYEQKQQARMDKIRNAATSAGGTKKRKVMHVEEEEERVGIGDAAIAAAAAAAESREEGRRLDTLLSLGHQAMLGAVDAYKSMAAQLLQRNHELERAHVRMMETIRVHYLARVDAEGAAAELERELDAKPEEEKKGALEKMADELLPVLLPAIMSNITAPTVPEKKQDKM